jgi:hypothetical protein
MKQRTKVQLVLSKTKYLHTAASHIVIMNPVVRSNLHVAKVTTIPLNQCHQIGSSSYFQLRKSDHETQ